MHEPVALRLHCAWRITSTVDRHLLLLLLLLPVHQPRKTRTTSHLVLTAFAVVSAATRGPPLSRCL